MPDSTNSPFGQDEILGLTPGKKKKPRVRRQTKKTLKVTLVRTKLPAKNVLAREKEKSGSEAGNLPVSSGEKEAGRPWSFFGRGKITSLSGKAVGKSAEIKKSVEPREPVAVAPLKPGFYRKIALTFIFLVLALLGVVFYFSFVKIKIIIVPSQEKISDSLIFDVLTPALSSGGGEAALAGEAEKLVLEYEEEYPATGEKVLSEEAGGEAIVYNKYIKNQPLVASTRLLTPDGKLFRLKETVNVPAGGEVKIQIYADNPGEISSLPATHFTFPGLWSGLQDKIYAESQKAIEVKKEVKKFITLADIENGTAKARQTLLANAKAEISAKYPQYDQVVYGINENSVKVDVDSKADEEKEVFKIKISAEVNAAAFSKNSSLDLIREKFSLTVPREKQLLGFDDQGVKYALVEEGFENGKAKVRADFTGKLALSESTNILNPEDLAGLTRAQLEEYLKGKEEIADYEIRFYPSFVRRVPNLLDRIEIEVLK
ncbi:MAG: hypothetical protein WCW25_00015 [Patescibacteria group bacterium]|jgi:hypothetical protein